MTPNFLWAGALSLVLIHDETGSCQSALNAALVLDKLCEMDLDDEPVCVSGDQHQHRGYWQKEVYQVLH